MLPDFRFAACVTFSNDASVVEGGHSDAVLHQFHSMGTGLTFSSSLHELGELMDRSSQDFRPLPSRPVSAGPREQVKKPTLRMAQDSDAAEVCDFLSKNMGRGISPQEYMAIFTYPWMSNPPNRGYILEWEGKIVGYLGAIYADRTIDGRVVRFCNLTNWCVTPEFRKSSTRLVSALLEPDNMIFTQLSPIPEVQPIFEWLGFKLLDEIKWFSFPGGNLFTLMNRRKASVICDADQIEGRLQGVELELFHHHQRKGIEHTLVVEGTQHLYVVSHKRKKKGISFSEILYVSSQKLLWRHFESVKLSILARDRALLLACDSRIVGKRPPCALRYRKIVQIKDNGISDVRIDNLYSEVALL